MPLCKKNRPIHPDAETYSNDKTIAGIRMMSDRLWMLEDDGLRRAPYTVPNGNHPVVQAIARDAFIHPSVREMSAHVAHCPQCRKFVGHPAKMCLIARRIIIKYLEHDELVIMFGSKENAKRFVEETLQPVGLSGVQDSALHEESETDAEQSCKTNPKEENER